MIVYAEDLKSRNYLKEKLGKPMAQYFVGKKTKKLFAESWNTNETFVKKAQKQFGKAIEVLI